MEPRASDKFCPNCGEIYRAGEQECPACHVPLEAAVPDDRPDPDATLVAVLETTERGLLPLARMALEQERIEYAVQNRGIADQIIGRRSSMTVGETDPPLRVVVRAEDEARAREVLRDLAGAPAAAPAPAAARARPAAAPRPVAAATPGSVTLTDADTGAAIGQLTPTQFASLAEHLELESADDDDYYLNEATVTMLDEKGADPAAVALLRDALFGRSDITIRWR
jgi:hypothetical protein